MPDTSYPKECKKSYCPVNNLRDDLADGLDDDLLDDLPQVDPSEIAVHDGNPHNTIDFSSLIIRSSADSYDDQELESPHFTPERSNRVRFRSRVRIASGLNRHRHKQQYLSSDFSPTSSISGSPSSSSSITAPLRTHTDEQVGKPGWGTLGQRVSMFAKGNMERRRGREQRERLALGASSLRKGVERRDLGGEDVAIPYYTQPDEETPLLSRPDANSSGSAREDQARGTDIFGPWPGRLVNLYVGFYPFLALNSLTGFALVVVADSAYNLLSLSE